jgi:TetR/AcrR family transcriptional regulator
MTAPPLVSDPPDSRQRLLEAAHAVFLRVGTAKARTQEIADAAGVNKALLHYYFGSKEALAREIFAQAHRDLWGRLLPLLAHPDRDLDAKVRGAVAAQFDFLEAHPYLPRFVAAEMLTNPERMAALITRRGAPPLDALQAQLDAEAAAGRMRPVPARQFVVTLMGAMMFPFVMRPALEAMELTGADGFAGFLAERRQFLPDFLLAGLRS